MTRPFITSIFLAAAMAVAAQTEATDSVSIVDKLLPDSVVEEMPLPAIFFMPQIYVPYEIADTLSLRPESSPESPASAQAWLAREKRIGQMVRTMRQRQALTHPENVHYIFADLPKAPEAMLVSGDHPESISITTGEILTSKNAAVEQVVINKQHWLNKLGINLQFSQAFVSPNWYQGGRNSLNLIADFLYTTNLNTKHHPKLLFENSFQWRTALTDAPDNQYRNYDITENRFQINSKFGYKAGNHWYYTITGMFKTPIFQSFNSSNEVSASFLSPGDLNIGAGMTYNLANKKNTLTYNVTIAPIAYNLKTLIDPDMYVSRAGNWGLENGHKTKSDYGSTVDMLLNWTICRNVSWRSRVFFFTNYKYTQTDWQNQFQFVINRFLTANLNVDLRYDTSITVPDGDAWKKGGIHWKKLQLREIISLGFTHTISH